MNELLEQFLIESRELAEQTTDDLLALEQSPEDRARLDSAFRGFHTLKGGAGIVEFDAMGRVVHAAEDLLASVRAGDAPLSADMVGHCLACLDQIGRWLDAMETEERVPAGADAVASTLVARFAEPGARPAHGTPAPSAASDRPPWLRDLLGRCPDVRRAGVAVRYVPHGECYFRGDDPLALVGRLNGLLALAIHPRNAWPQLDHLDPFACNLVIDALASGARDAVADHFAAVAGHVEIHALSEGTEAGGLIVPERAAEILRAQIALASSSDRGSFDATLTSAGRTAGNVLRHLRCDAKAAEIDAALARSLAAGEATALVAAIETILAAPDEAGGREGTADTAAARPATIARTLHVDVGRVDAIVNLTGELTIVKNALGHAVRLAQDGADAASLAPLLKQQHAQLERLTAELQRSALSIRVLPLRQVFRRFPPLVREIGKRLGKSARLVMAGEETEADKVVVEALYEPLMHVIRNAIDHGVDSPEERNAAGKPAVPVIRLSGRREGEHVIVEIEDDGRGIDAAKVRHAAAMQGVATPEALAALSDDEAVELIFAPGLSTAATVTTLSGRGVGMDAVRSAIERLGGRVTVASRAYQGTTVRLTLPFTVMMTQVLTVEVAGQLVGIPFHAVLETVQLRRDHIAPVGDARAFALRGRTVPLVDLARELAFVEGPRSSTVASIVVVALGGELGGFEVDRFGERLDIMLKPMGGLLSETPGVAGTTLLGDGRVLIVLDLEELLR